MPEISRRAESLGTENAFVVLAEVNTGGADCECDVNSVVDY